MQDRYVGDIGDYFKYGLLRALSPSRRLGVAWYLYPDEGHNRDGKHVSYLKKPLIWRKYDPELFDVLKNLVEVKNRSVASVQKSGILGSVLFSDNILEVGSKFNYAQRVAWRRAWVNQTLKDLKTCDLVFADPDNGLCEDEKYKFGTIKKWKSLPLCEGLSLSQGRPAILFHHNTRFSGGHKSENRYWCERLGKGTLALNWRAFGSRTFFLVNFDRVLQNRVKVFANSWGPKVDLT